MRQTLLCLLLLCAASSVQAQQRIPIAVNHSGDDVVGERLAFEIREAIRRSAAYELTSVDNSLFQIQLVTIDPQDRGSRNAGNQTVAAIAYTVSNLIPFEEKNPQTWLRMLLTANVQTCGRNVVDGCAKGLVAILDREIEKYKRAAGR